MKKQEPKINKKRIVKDFENLSPELSAALHAAYPAGFADSMISFFDKDGKRVAAVPFETDEIYYLIRMVERKTKIAKADIDVDPDAEVDSPPTDDDLFQDEAAMGDDDEAEGDVSLDEIENADNQFKDDDNY